MANFGNFATYLQKGFNPSGIHRTCSFLMNEAYSVHSLRQVFWTEMIHSPTYPLLLHEISMGRRPVQELVLMLEFVTLGTTWDSTELPRPN